MEKADRPVEEPPHALLRMVVPDALLAMGFDLAQGRAGRLV
jgi:hypothetical protein